MKETFGLVSTLVLFLFLENTFMRALSSFNFTLIVLSSLFFFLLAASGLSPFFFLAEVGSG